MIIKTGCLIYIQLINSAISKLLSLILTKLFHHWKQELKAFTDLSEEQIKLK